VSFASGEKERKRRGLAPLVLSGRKTSVISATLEEGNARRKSFQKNLAV